MITWPLITFPPINLWSLPKYMQTPCKSECLYNPNLGFCESCGRTLDDLSVWTSISSEERKVRIKQAKERRRKLESTNSV